jgi:2-oxoisovalerate dehydrogenase E1 component
LILPTTSANVRLDTYRMIRLIRSFEERTLALRRAGAVAGSVHLCGGQEAVAVGAISAVGPADPVLVTYRGHGWALARGVAPELLFAEILGRSTGTNGGRGGSAYLSAPDHRFLGENSIVGAGLPIANGVALAAQFRGDATVTVVAFGEGATSAGAAHEAFVMAVARQLPVVFICENNAWSEMTPISAITPVAHLSLRAPGYGMPGETVDGNDASAVATVVGRAADRARRGDGPTFVECMTTRLMAHYDGDVEHYRRREDIEADLLLDPLIRLRDMLLASGCVESELLAVDASVEADLEVAEAWAVDSPLADPTTAADHVTAMTRSNSIAVRDDNVTELTYAAAVNEALRRELKTRDEVVLFGEDIAVPGGVFGVTRRLQKEFGEHRVFDTPIAESAILGAAVGASQEGLRPVVEVMWADFLLVALDQLVNQAANVRYIHQGGRTAPMVVRCQQGVTPGSCAQHSQSLEALLAHIPGLKVGLPSNPADAYAMLRAAVADDDPTVLIECRALYQESGPVPLDAAVEAVGGARTVRRGGDLAIVSWGRMVNRVLEAADVLSNQGVEATIVDLRWIAPVDWATVIEAVELTRSALVVHEANRTGGFGAEVAATIGERCFSSLSQPIRRLATPDVRIPSAPTLSEVLVPNAGAVVNAAMEMVG